MPDPRTAAAGYEQWPMGAPQDPGYELGNFLPAGAPRPGGMPDDPLQQQPEWASYASGQMGYEPAHGGALEQSYAQDEGGDYETDEPRRGSWTLRIVGAIVVAIGLGYGLAQGYKLVADSQPDGAPPVVRGDSAPSKTKPTDPGGKQFAHTDSKIMGRLGEGTPGGEPSAGASDSDADVNGARKVQTLVVGRDGSIAPPAAPEEPATTGAVAVPGLTVVDGFGGRYPQPVETAAAPEPTSQPGPQAARQPIVVKPPAPETKPLKVAKATTIETAEPEPAPEAPDTPDTTSDAAPAAAPAEPEEPKKTAAVAPPPSGGANGYVVVLASVPASGDSRLSALRKFADMQQKYGTVLQNRTPDVQEANLGAKGTYHRLLVGPPGSRAQASALCNDLKTAGYKDCWVMAY
jgi:septal ring-binding cell division protein DamX